MKLKLLIGTLPIEVDFDGSDEDGAYRQLVIARPVFAAQPQITYTVSDTAPWEETGRVEMTSGGTSVTVSGTVVLGEQEPELFAGIAQIELMDVIGAERYHALAQRAAEEMGWPDAGSDVSWQDVVRQLVVESVPAKFSLDPEKLEVLHRRFLRSLGDNSHDGILTITMEELSTLLVHELEIHLDADYDQPT